MGKALARQLASDPVTGILAMKWLGKRKAELGDRKYYGRYIGISPLAAGQGLSFEDACLNFVFLNDGFRIEEKIECGNGVLKFMQYFPASWIFRSKDWGFDHCLSIRQHEASPMAQLAFDFSKHNCGRYNVDAVMHLYENGLNIFGIFVKEKWGRESHDILRGMYELFYRPAEEHKGEIFVLIEVDDGRARRVLGESAYAANEKIAVIRSLAHNLIFAPQALIVKRLDLLMISLYDENPMIQETVLDCFLSGARVNEAMPMLKEFYRQKKSKIHRLVVKKLIEVVASFMADARHFTELTERIKQDYKTADIREIRNMRNGEVSPESFDMIKKIASCRACQAWTINMHMDLIDTMYEIYHAYEGKDPDIEIDCLMAIMKYPLVTP